MLNVDKSSSSAKEPSLQGPVEPYWEQTQLICMTSLSAKEPSLQGPVEPYWEQT